MTGVRTLEVGSDEGELRLDRWFRRHFPGLGHGRLEKLLRTGQVRVDGARAKGSTRLVAGMRRAQQRVLLVLHDVVQPGHVAVCHRWQPNGAGAQAPHCGGFY